MDNALTPALLSGGGATAMTPNVLTSESGSRPFNGFKHSQGSDLFWWSCQTVTPSGTRGSHQHPCCNQALKILGQIGLR